MEETVMTALMREGEEAKGKEMSAAIALMT